MPNPAPTQPQPPASAPKPAAPMKQSPFRFVAPLLIILVVVGALYFAATRFLHINLPFGQSSNSGPITLTYWGLWEPNSVMQATFAAFEQAHPGVTIQYEQQKITDYRQRLQTALQNGTGPTLFRYHDTWVPMLRNDLAVLPSSIVSDQTYQSEFYPIATTMLKTSKGFVGIPLEIDGLGLYYNQDLLTAAGQPVPTSWDELRRVAKQLTVTQDGRIERGGVALGTTSNVDHWPDILAVMMYQNAADPKTPNNKLGQDALDFYTIFSKTDKVWNDSMPASTYAFATGKVAMMLAPSWRAHDVLAIAPDLKFGIAPIPQLPDTNITWASFWVEGVSVHATSREQQAAWELLNYLSQKDTLRSWYAEISSTRRFGEPFSRIDMADQLVSDPLVGAYVKQAPNARSWYLSSATFDNGINDDIIKYYQDAVNAVNLGTTADKALGTTEQGITQVFQKYNLR